MDEREKEMDISRITIPGVNKCVYIGTYVFPAVDLNMTTWDFLTIQAFEEHRLGLGESENLFPQKLERRISKPTGHC